MMLFKKWKKNWDAICNRCGKCCYEKEFIQGGALIIDYEKPCRFLDEETMLCRVYVNRFNACKECRKVTFWTVLFSPALPPDCGYVVKVRSALKIRKFWNRPIQH